jgi:hypothetical protein
MPTYRLGDPSPYARTTPPPRELICEICGQVLRTVVQSDARSGMTADEVIQTWPFLDREVDEHEQTCSPP